MTDRPFEWLYASPDEGCGEPINLRDLGFVGTVSDEALAEIAANERRASRVLSTAHLYWFRGLR